jgi:hypothetical protein
MRAFRTTAIACLLPLSVLSAGCGGGERQDKNEPKGSFSIEVEKAEFPGKQSLAKSTELAIVVKNTDTKALPDVAVTVDRFSSTSDQAGLADTQRPVWIVDQGPAGGETAYVNTWALGRLAPGASKTFRWKVTAVQAGAHEISYKVSPGLDGRATVADAASATGKFKVNISREPAQARVDPETGEVVRGEGATAQP